jgi:hypothetical protein
MGDKLMEKMGGGKRDKTFFCTLMCIVHTHIQDVFLKILKK